MFPNQQSRKKSIGARNFLVQCCPINIVTMDFAAVERRAMAYVEQQGDIHAMRAAKEFGVTEEDVTERQRQHAKKLNFMDIYGGCNE